MYKEIDVNSSSGDCLINITEQIQDAVRDSKVEEGICVVFIPHTTAAIAINSSLDPMTHKDIIEDTRRLVPTRVDFNHIYDTPSDAAGHIKSVLIGNSLSLIVKQGKLLLGSSQSILFYEFDGPRQRRVMLRVISGN
jgi:secondary thiamine-phosphate synthase enzyme